MRRYSELTKITLINAGKYKPFKCNSIDAIREIQSADGFFDSFTQYLMSDGKEEDWLLANKAKQVSVPGTGGKVSWWFWNYLGVNEPPEIIEA